MDTRRLRKHYQQLDKDTLINILIKSREDVELLSKEDEKCRVIKKQQKTIKRALQYIDFYTINKKYITGNDRELINILKTGVPGVWYETYKTQQAKDKRTLSH